MIKIIERHDQKPIKKYRVTCHICKTVFECDTTDMHKKTVCQGIMDANAVFCPVCQNDCCSWYGVDEFKEIKD